MHIKIHDSLSKFECLGDKCSDTCCKSWNMQFDMEHKDLYAKKAPELLDAITEFDGGYIMRRDKKSGYCVKFDDGWCGVHKEYGDDFLGDACHFYPRASKKVGNLNIMSATISCPEIARLALIEGRASTYSDGELKRLPNILKDYLPEGFAEQSVFDVHQTFMQNIVKDADSAELAMKRLVTAARSLDFIDKSQWHEAAGFVIKMADMRIVASEPDAEDEMRALMALAILINASNNDINPRLKDVFHDIEDYLGVKIEFATMNVVAALKKLDDVTLPPEYQQIMRNWLKMQLSLGLFPFGGFGGSLYERAVIIAVRFATLKLALKSSFQNKGEDKIVKPAQSLARFLDHLADPTLSVEIYKSFDWFHEARINGLIDGGVKNSI